MTGFTSMVTQKGMRLSHTFGQCFDIVVLVFKSLSLKSRDQKNIGLPVSQHISICNMTDVEKKNQTEPTISFNNKVHCYNSWLTKRNRCILLPCWFSRFRGLEFLLLLKYTVHCIVGKKGDIY